MVDRGIGRVPFGVAIRSNNETFACDGWDVAGVNVEVACEGGDDAGIHSSSSSESLSTSSGMAADPDPVFSDNCSAFRFLKSTVPDETAVSWTVAELGIPQPGI